MNVQGEEWPFPLGVGIRMSSNSLILSSLTKCHSNSMGLPYQHTFLQAEFPSDTAHPCLWPKMASYSQCSTLPLTRALRPLVKSSVLENKVLFKTQYCRNQTPVITQSHEKDPLLTLMHDGLYCMGGWGTQVQCHWILTTVSVGA